MDTNHTTDNDRLAWLDAARCCIQIGKVSHGASIEFEGGAWVLRVTNGADMDRSEHSTLRAAIDALRDSDVPSGDGVKCIHCDAEMEEEELRKCDADEPICDTCNSQLPKASDITNPRAGIEAYLNRGAE